MAKNLEYYWNSIYFYLKIERPFWFKMIIWAIVISVYFFIMFNTIFHEPKLNKYQNEFNVLIDKYLAGKKAYSINSNDLRIIFNSVNRKSDGVLHQYGYISILEDYLVHIATDDNEKNDIFYKSIFTTLENEKKQEPFSNLPSEERRILLNLENSIKSYDKQTALLNLSSLNDVLRMANEHREKIEKQNRWAIPLAIAGLIATILLGAISIIRSFQLAKREKSSRKGLKKS